MEPVAYFELNFRPNVALVSVVRRFVTEFYERFLSDPDGTSRVALATHELLENAVKYSKDGETTIRIEVDVTQKPIVVKLRLRNRAEVAHIAAIKELLAGINAAPDSFTFYQQLMQKKSKLRVGSGFGLARICAEGEMSLRDIVEGDTVTIEATTTVGART